LVNNILKPGLKLIGVKTKIRQRLYDLFPKSYDRYVEPFLGTGGVLIGSKPVQYEYGLDLNQYVINYYQILQYEPQAFWETLEGALEPPFYNPKADFATFRYHAIHNENKVSRAVFFYIVTKTCINGIWRLNKKGECNSSYCGTFQGRGFFTEEWFWQVVERIKNVQFAVQDYKTTLSMKYPKSTFIFVDPPYRACKTTYNGVSFSDEDHLDLYHLLCSQPAKWMVTINNDEFTRELYKCFNIHTHEVNYSCSQTNAGRGNKPELIITNYDT
jgi:DNA adenine methylase